MLFGDMLNLGKTSDEINLGDVRRGGFRRIGQPIPETEEFTRKQRGTVSKPMGLEDSPEVDWTQEETEVNPAVFEIGKLIVNIIGEDPEFILNMFQKSGVSREIDRLWGRFLSVKGRG